MKTDCRLAFALVTALAVAGCAVNPVTKQPELSTMSTQREAEIGAEASKVVAEQIGLVEDPELARYVEAVGQRLAQRSPRQDTAYHFAVANMEVPNAFALPGGWIYLSRGLLVLTNSEAELANVLGHEIAHVAARHAASREAHSIGAGLLSMMGSVVSTATLGVGAGIGRLFQIAGAGAIASYSRGQERQADEIGQELAAFSGWDPKALSRFLETLEIDTELEDEPSQLPDFLSSHPLTGDRIARSAQHAATLTIAPGAPIAASREAFLKKLDGLLVGPDPAHGLFRGGRFLHPGLAMTIDFPSGWTTHNSEQVVAAISPDEDALIALQIQEEGNDAKTAALRFAEAHRVALSDERALTIAGRPAYRAVAMAQTQDGRLGFELCWIAHRDMIFRFTGMAPADRFGRHQAALARTSQSFGNLSATELASIHDLRLRVVRAQGGESLAALSRRTGNAMSLEKTAIANSLATDAVLAAGDPVKIAIKVRYAR
ncbi:MAG: M48 family metalloprotease [Deltaproteobacteria bacterium]|nr:M48 family metalloprotease [Deltaproteobacteria bacterium]